MIVVAIRGYLRHVEDIFCKALVQAQQAGEISATVNSRDHVPPDSTVRLLVSRPISSVG